MSAHPPITGDDRTDDHSADSHDADHLGHEGHNLSLIHISEPTRPY